MSREIRRALVLRSFHVGVDLGQRQDHSAIVVVEQRVEAAGEWDRVTFEPVYERRLVVRLVKRVPLRVGYGLVAAEVERLTQSPELAGGLVTTAVDATGLGAVVTEDLRKRRLRGELYPVVVTGGQEGRQKDGFWMTPRTDLLLTVMQAFEGQQLGVARGVEEWGLLREELQGMRRRPAEGGIRIETVGRHDDLVFALALGLFGVKQRVLPVRGEAVRWRVGRAMPLRR